VWYNIRIELKGATVKCYLNDRLAQAGECKPTHALYAAAGRDHQSGETVLAVANPSGQKLATRVKLNGPRSVSPKVQAVMLSSDSEDDVNSFEQPDKISPREFTFQVNGPEFEHQFPPWSFTLLRVKSK
jgi:alpha-L-arabinofuranosidase